MSLQQQCLPLPRKSRKRPPPGAVESSGQDEGPMEIASLTSMDAMAYLASVRQQASSLPDIFVSPSSSTAAGQTPSSERPREEMDAIDGSAAARNYLLSHRLKFHSPPSCLTSYIPNHSNGTTGPTPLSSWVDRTMYNFSSLRTYLHACQKGLNRDMDKEERIKVPKSRDSTAWHIFCLGTEGLQIELEEYDDDDDDDDDKRGPREPEDHPNRIFETYNVPPNGHGPCTKLTCQFDQIIFRRLLSHHTHYISKRGMDVRRLSDKRAKWIYAILSRLEKPLHRDEASVLSELLRELCRLRYELGVDLSVEQFEGGGGGGSGSGDGNRSASVCERVKEELERMNVLIALVGIYFEQCTDLEKLFGTCTMST